MKGRTALELRHQAEADPLDEPGPLPVDLVCMALTLPQAYALAELCKRIGWTDVRTNAAGDMEARNMLSAMGRVRAALEEAGVRVR